jgi:hypothetical protein
VGVLTASGSSPILVSITYLLGAGGTGGASSGNAGTEGVRAETHRPE